MKYLIIICGLVLLFGCISPPGPGGNDKNNTLKPKTPDYNNLMSEEELREQFGCHFGVDNETSTEKLVIWACNKDIYELNLSEDENPYEYGIYQVDAHPLGTFAVTYVLYNGTDYIEIMEPGQLTQYFVPLENEADALTYAYLYEGLWMFYGPSSEAPLEGKTNVKKEAGNYIVTILHGSHNMCPCYGTDSKSVYRVVPNGDITKISSKVIHSFQEPDCMC